MCGMVCLREDGKQMPALIHKYLGNKTFNVYNVFVCLLMLLVGAVFVYTPGDLIVGFNWYRKCCYKSCSMDCICYYFYLLLNCNIIPY